MSPWEIFGWIAAACLSLLLVVMTITITVTLIGNARRSKRSKRVDLYRGKRD